MKQQLTNDTSKTNEMICVIMIDTYAKKIIDNLSELIDSFGNTISEHFQTELINYDPLKTIKTKTQTVTYCNTIELLRNFFVDGLQKVQEKIVITNTIKTIINITLEYNNEEPINDNEEKTIEKRIRDVIKNWRVFRENNLKLPLFHLIINNSDSQNSFYKRLMNTLSKSIPTNSMIKEIDPITTNAFKLEEGFEKLGKTALKPDLFEIERQSIEKPESYTYSDTNKLRKNEDRIIIRERNKDSVIFGVADGAGSSGIYCGEWAHHILTNIIKEKPIQDCKTLNDWLNILAHNFYSEYKEKGNDIDVKNKFIKEGSYCSLLTGWLKHRTKGKYILETTIYGDSTLFIFQKNGALKSIYPYESVSKFDTAPHLISLKHDAIQDHFIYQSIEIDYTDIIIAASDGFSKFLLTQYLLFTNNNRLLTINNKYLSQLDQAHKYNHDFIYLLGIIKDKLKKTEDFRSFVKELYVGELIPNDDCSVIYITFIEEKEDNEYKIDDYCILELEKFCVDWYDAFISGSTEIEDETFSIRNIIANIFVL